MEFCRLDRQNESGLDFKNAGLENCFAFSEKDIAPLRAVETSDQSVCARVRLVQKDDVSSSRHCGSWSLQEE